MRGLLGHINFCKALWKTCILCSPWIFSPLDYFGKWRINEGFLTYLMTTHPDPSLGAFHMTCTSVLGRSSASLTVLMQSSSKAEMVSANSWNWPVVGGATSAPGVRGSTPSEKRENCCSRLWVRAPTKVTGQYQIINNYTGQHTFWLVSI